MNQHSQPKPMSTTSCFSAVFRRLLCSGSLPTHPSDQFPDNPAGQEAENFSEPGVINVKRGTSSSPGVVAKLMGLDPFPDSPSWAQNDRRRRSLGSFLRSRSANSIDFLPPFDPARQHRRARTSVSFRDGLHCPDYVSMVSILGKVDEIGEGEEKRGGNECIDKSCERNVTRKEVEMGEEKRWVRRRKDLHVKKRLVLKEKKAAVKTVGFKEELLQSRCSKIKQNQISAHKDKMHCGSNIHPSETVPAAVCGKRGHSRRNVPSQTAGSRSRCPKKADSRNQVAIEAIPKGKNDKKIRNNERCGYKRTVETICGLAEASLYENWTNDGSMKFEDFEEYVSKWLGREILEGLLEQLVDELEHVRGRNYISYICG